MKYIPEVLTAPDVPKKKKKRNNIYSVVSHALLNSLKIFINTISSISSHHTKYPKTVPYDLCACCFP